MKNEFGEEITIDEINNAIKKLTKLSEKEIDNFCMKIKWIEEDRGDNLAISNERIKLIKKKGNHSTKIIKAILAETPKKDFFTILDYLFLEKRKRT